MSGASKLGPDSELRNLQGGGVSSVACTETKQSTGARQEESQAPAAVGSLAVRGAAWTLFLALVQKVLTVGVQFTLAWLLLPGEMGVAGIAFAASSALAVFRTGSLQRVLIQRQGDFEEQAPQVFWLSVVMSLSAGLVLAASAPLLASFFGRPELLAHLLILAAASPLSSLTTVHAALLYRNLRFRTLSMIHLGEAVISGGGTVVLALAGFGAFSMTIPPVLQAVFAAIACRRTAGPVRVGSPVPRHWPALLRPAAWLMVMGGATAVQGYGVNFVVGKLQGPDSVGFYSWGFLVSAQVVLLLNRNLQNVFFPALSRLQSSDARLRDALEKGCTVLSAGLVPVCVLQAVLAEPLIFLFFGERWAPAAGVVRWLSMGLLTSPLSALTDALLLARGNYSSAALRVTGVALALIAAACCGALVGDHVTVAAYTAMALAAGNVAAALITIVPLGREWIRKLARGSVPLLAVIPCWTFANLASVALAESHPLLHVAVVSLVVLSIHGLLTLLFWRNAVSDIWERLRPRTPPTARDGC